MTTRRRWLQAHFVRPFSRMASSRRWLQFSLRGFLIVLTISCLWLGWKIERARKRGQAIDAIVEDGATVWYGTHADLPAGASVPVVSRQDRHLWQDIVETPVNVVWDVRLNENTALNLPKLLRINELVIYGALRNDDLRFLEHTTPHRLLIFEPKGITQSAATRLEKWLPKTEMSYYDKKSNRWWLARQYYPPDFFISENAVGHLDSQDR